MGMIRQTMQAKSPAETESVCEGESWRLQAAAFADFQYVAHRPL